MNVLNRLIFWFDFIFYVIFSYYYNKGKFSDKNYPPLGKTYFIMVIFVGNLFLFLYLCIKQVVDIQIDTSSRGHFPKVMALFSLLAVYVILVYRKRYVRVYNRLKDQPFVNSKKGKILGWTLYFIGLASPIILAYAIFKIKY